MYLVLEAFKNSEAQTTLQVHYISISGSRILASIVLTSPPGDSYVNYILWL